MFDENLEENNSNMEERFKQFEDEYLKFDDIPDNEKLHLNKNLCGILKAVSLMKDPSKFSFQAKHDVVYLVHHSDLKELADEDILYLTRCGISWDEGLVSFC